MKYTLSPEMRGNAKFIQFIKNLEMDVNYDALELEARIYRMLRDSVNPGLQKECEWCLRHAAGAPIIYMKLKDIDYSPLYVGYPDYPRGGNFESHWAMDRPLGGGSFWYQIIEKFGIDT